MLGCFICDKTFTCTVEYQSSKRDNLLLCSYELAFLLHATVSKMHVARLGVASACMAYLFARLVSLLAGHLRISLTRAHEYFTTHKLQLHAMHTHSHLGDVDFFDDKVLAVILPLHQQSLPKRALSYFLDSHVPLHF